MRIEYLRARARALRFREHIEFLKEEKRRVLISLEAEASIWDRREREGLIEDTIMGQGRAAYAARQASIRRELLKVFGAIWSKFPTVSTTDSDNGDSLAARVTLIVNDDVSDASGIDSDSDYDE